MVEIYKKIALFIKNKRMIIPVIIAVIAASLILIPRHGSDGDSARALTYAMLSDDLEERIENLCRSVDGVRYAKVLLTLDTSEEYVLAKDTEIRGDSVKVETVTGEGGGIELYVVSPKVRGVAVVCTGGDKPVMKKTITELLSASLGIDTTKISVAGS